jgi:hypothetical protein
MRIVIFIITFMIFATVSLIGLWLPSSVHAINGPQAIPTSAKVPPTNTTVAQNVSGGGSSGSGAGDELTQTAFAITQTALAITPTALQLPLQLPLQLLLQQSYVSLVLPQRLSNRAGYRTPAVSIVAIFGKILPCCC